MATTTSIDAERRSDAHDVRPIVARDSGNRPLWLALSALGVVGGLLFTTLEARRATISSPAVRPRAADLSVMPQSSVPPLFVPPAIDDGPMQAVAPILSPQAPIASGPPSVTGRTSVPSFPFGQPLQPPQMQPPIIAPKTVDASPVIVFDAAMSDAPPVGAGGNGQGGATGTGAAIARPRARAGRLANRATIVPQGTLIAAVLETALDSTQPGQTRALVSRDVVNLHGDHVLIPRGSRLFGEYGGALSAGQNRAQVLWTRLVRPDGVTIAIDSPAADRLGRAGIRGKVNTHFLERLGGALLQSSIDIGTGVATRSISDNAVVVALPGSLQGATSQLVPPSPGPTLRVKQGTRISVFVARDLDFTSVEGRE